MIDFGFDAMRPNRCIVKYEFFSTYNLPFLILSDLRALCGSFAFNKGALAFNKKIFLSMIP